MQKTPHIEIVNHHAGVSHMDRVSHFTVQRVDMNAPLGQRTTILGTFDVTERDAAFECARVARLADEILILQASTGKYPHDGQCEHNDMLEGSRRCTAPATTILEYELEGKHGGTRYFCGRHARYNAELILGAGGSPRLGNV